MDRFDFEKIAPRLRRLITDMVKAMPGGVGNAIADDVAQDTLLKLWMMRSRLDEYRSIDSLAIVVARRCAIDILRKDSRSAPIPEVIPESSTDSSPEERMIASEENSRLMDVIASLPSGQQAVVRMKHIEGLETGEIARITGSTEVAVRVSLSRARHAIRDKFLNQKK